MHDGWPRHTFFVKPESLFAREPRDMQEMQGGSNNSFFASCTYRARLSYLAHTLQPAPQ